MSKELYQERPEVIVLSAILPDPINTYLSDFREGIIDAINGKKMKTLEDMAAAFAEPAEFYVWISSVSAGLSMLNGRPSKHGNGSANVTTSCRTESVAQAITAHAPLHRCPLAPRLRAQFRSTHSFRRKTPAPTPPGSVPPGPTPPRPPNGRPPALPPAPQPPRRRTAGGTVVAVGRPTRSGPAGEAAAPIAVKSEDKLSVIRVNVTNQPWDFCGRGENVLRIRDARSARCWRETRPRHRRVGGDANYVELETPDGSEKTPASIEDCRLRGKPRDTEAGGEKNSWMPTNQLNLRRRRSATRCRVAAQHGNRLVTKGSMTTAEVSALSN